jgi:hypothetical protein
MCKSLTGDQLGSHICVQAAELQVFKTEVPRGSD